MFRVLLALAIAGHLALAQRDSLVEKIRPLALSWTPGANPLPPHQYLSGTKREESDKRGLPLGILIAKQQIELPEQFDARERWPECPSLREIRNQGCCAGCWAISAAETFSDRWCIHSGGKSQFSFGALDLLSCCPKCGEGCSGAGYLGNSWLHWVRGGVASGGPYNSNRGCHPYPFDVCQSPDEQDDAPKCDLKCQASYNVTNVADDRRFGRIAYRVHPEETAIMEEIFVHGPVQASMDIYYDFKAYRTGVYRHVFGPQDSEHAIKILGWGVENGVKYWLCSNSWGQDWGADGGFFKIVRGEDHCGIESNVHAGLPDYNRRS
ncbi:cathepsin B-like [Culex quinquefasciatus]|uniref:cathepsin B-like n=1 Tax=Culex quinquefasciatus TaxID=7176 RepID=UPI0018E3AB0A|nr:cathepsin B-like [Culex quinquefasciatus]